MDAQEDNPLEAASGFYQHVDSLLGDNTEVPEFIVDAMNRCHDAASAGDVYGARMAIGNARALITERFDLSGANDEN